MAALRLEVTETGTSREMILPIIIASTLGSAIEWFDFFYYSFLAVMVFPLVFFPHLDPVAGIVASFTANFVGFAARPLGGIFFGRAGDRVGRKAMLAATLLLIGITTMLMGVLPGYGTLGIAAPLLLTTLRFLQGVGVGGEWGGSVLLTMESCNQKARGFWTSWPQVGVPVGLVLSSVSVLLFRSLYPGDAFQSLGWRIPFLLSTMVVAVALYIRLRIPETPAFLHIKAQQRTPGTLWATWRTYWRAILFSALLRSGEQAPFYLFTTFVLSYGLVYLHLGASLFYGGLAIASVLSCLTIPVFGAISDRVGRLRMAKCSACVMICFVFPYFLLLNTRSPILIILAIVLALGLIHASFYGPQSALIAERFSTEVRYTGASLGYQLASISAGGPAPIIATYLMTHVSSQAGAVPAWVFIALYIIAMSLISLLAAHFLKEYTGRAVADGQSVEILSGQ